MILDCGGKRSATPLWDRPSRCQSGVALRFPPQSKTLRLRLRRATGLASPTITHTTKGHLCGVAAQAERRTPVRPASEIRAELEFCAPRLQHLLLAVECRKPRNEAGVISSRIPVVAERQTDGSRKALSPRETCSAAPLRRVATLEPPPHAKPSAVATRRIPPGVPS